MEDDQHLSNIEEGDEQLKKGEGADPMGKDEPNNEASSKPEETNNSNHPFGMIIQPTTTSTNTPRILSQAELDNLKATNPAGFLKAMMSARSSLS